jgi:hypothetical protein
MSLAESFRKYPQFSNSEVAETIGNSKSVRKLGPNEFSGPVSSWAKDRERIYGETIVPRHVYVIDLPKGQKHRVAWVYHEGFTPDNMPFCQHEIACDCSGEIEELYSPEEKEAVIEECPGLMPALELQALAVNKALQIDDILQHALKFHKETPMDEQPELIQAFVGASLFHLLKNDYLYPRSWIANVESGWTMTALASKVLNVPGEGVEWAAGELEQQDIVQIESPVISLSEKMKQKLEEEKAKREMFKFFEGQMTA